MLVITDLSPASNNAVWRGARIARERGASLRLLHVSAGAKHMAGARQALGSIGRQLHEHLGIELDAQALEGELLPAAISAARAAGLLVIGPRRANPLREWISGTQAERLIRLCRIPTLVVKRPATPGRNATPGPPEHGRYGRVLVSVDLRPEAVDLIAAAMSLSRDPQPQVFHAVVANANGRATAPEALVAHPGETAIQKAQAMLRDFIKSSGAQKLGAVSAVAFGHAARCVLARERATGAELVVIGKRQRGLLADFILGGVTQQVLASSRADVLVMPNRPAPTWQPMAPARPP
ncbi:universal stress protein [Ramlibacter tataouinensis]|uniref:universal stress protein n=1 Tax=Ramlibacter tataouinensis TaxID=94132 RepID=UPI0002E883A8|nr:universal stress protein [Ramlibacter tataouinensis]